MKDIKNSFCNFTKKLQIHQIKVTWNLYLLYFFSYGFPKYYAILRYFGQFSQITAFFFFFTAINLFRCIVHKNDIKLKHKFFVCLPSLPLSQIFRRENVVRDVLSRPPLSAMYQSSRDNWQGTWSSSQDKLWRFCLCNPCDMSCLWDFLPVLVYCDQTGYCKQPNILVWMHILVWIHEHIVVWFSRFS